MTRRGAKGTKGGFRGFRAFRGYRVSESPADAERGFSVMAKLRARKGGRCGGRGGRL